MRPALVIQLAKRERVAAFRAGLGGAEDVVVPGIDAKTFSTLPRLDAVYLSLTSTERWGSCPLAPREAAILETGSTGAQEGAASSLVTPDGGPAPSRSMAGCWR